MAKRNDDRAPMNGVHFEVLRRIEMEPNIDIQLLGEFGDDYETYVRDLRRNDYPIWSLPSNSPDLPESRVFYFERPGTELARCAWCKRRVKSIGPFCSVDCEQDFIADRLAAPENEEPETCHIKDEQRSKPCDIPRYTIRRRSIGGHCDRGYRKFDPRHHGSLRKMSQERGIPISASCVLHVGQVAKRNNRLSEDDWWTFMSLGSQVYSGKKLSKTMRKRLLKAIERAVLIGVQNDGCGKPDCLMCDEFKRYARGTGDVSGSNL